MKNIYLLILTITFLSCAGNTDKNVSTDSANAIEDHPLQDTQVAPFPNGYAAPNAKIDTSKRIKDSLASTKH